MNRTRPFVLVICDGWGYNPDPYGNAIAAAATPQMDALMQRWPHTLVAASGEAVGLPPGQQGNSEVGHLTIGSGRILHQPLSRINVAISSGEFFANDVLCATVDGARERGRALHCLGLVSPGGVHSDQAHAVAIAELARRRGFSDVLFHAFTDGRDSPPTSAAAYMARFCADLDGVGVGRIASISGRYYAMDRDRRWDRTRRAYEVIAGAADGVAAPPVAYVEAQYAAGITDEFIEPASILTDGRRVRIEDGDSVIFFNFRPDRARQLIHALVDAGFSGFQRSRLPSDLLVATFTEYERDLPVAVAFPREDVRHTLGEEVSRRGLHQFHVAETEKYAHVTYFINGGREAAFDHEERLLVPSPKVATYDTVPAMSAEAVTEQVMAHVGSGADSLIVVNFANPDMVGHTGVFDATVAAVELVDTMMGRVAGATLAAEGAMLMTSDHGNAEYKIDSRDGSVLTAHTTSPVPVLLAGTDARALRDGGGLRDIAPTVLEAMSLPIPEEMTGRSLVVR